MATRGRRTLDLLLALTMLSVWAFGAPLHRLQCHSPQPRLSHQNLERAANRPCPASPGGHCCHHHGTGDKPASECPPADCPDDSDHCSLCLLLLQAGTLDPAVVVVESIVATERTRLLPPGRPIASQALLYESRGPPAAQA